MKNKICPSPAGDQYNTAHEVHYSAKNLHRALGLYEDIVAAHPESREAGYSRTQIQNIAKAVIPPRELLAAESRLALSHLEKGEQRPAQRPEQNEAGR